MCRRIDIVSCYPLVLLLSIQIWSVRARLDQLQLTLYYRSKQSACSLRRRNGTLLTATPERHLRYGQHLDSKAAAH